ncbi:MAG: hypothetical protein PHW74_05515 [Desulfobacca sp.]|nr:hypothetical protein [Desulfobacca sp.]
MSTIFLAFPLALARLPVRTATLTASLALPSALGHGHIGEAEATCY